MHKERPDDEVAVVGTSLMAQTVMSDEELHHHQDEDQGE